MSSLRELKRLLVGDDPDLQFACRGCGATFDVEYHVCPDCGGFSVERTYDP